MSGGSYDYAYRHVEDMASRLRDRSPASPERMAFVGLLDRVATAMHAIEWVDSGDTSPGAEMEAIAACVSPTDVLAVATTQAEGALASLTAALEAARRADG